VFVRVFVCVCMCVWVDVNFLANTILAQVRDISECVCVCV